MGVLSSTEDIIYDILQSADDGERMFAKLMKDNYIMFTNEDYNILQKTIDSIYWKQNVIIRYKLQNGILLKQTINGYIEDINHRKIGEVVIVTNYQGKLLPISVMASGQTN